MIRRRDWVISSMAAGGAALFGCAGRESASSHPADTVAPGAGVEPPSRFEELRGFCDGVGPVEAVEFEQRVERGRALAKREGFDAFVVEAGVNLSYFTGVRWGQSERPLLLLIPLDAEPAWIGPAFERGTLTERINGTGEVHGWHEHESPYERFGEALSSRGLGRGRIAIDPAMRLFVFDGLRRALGDARFESGDAIFSGCRMLKSDRELARLRRANEATKAALKAASVHIVEGMSEVEISALVTEAQEVAGLSQVWVLALTGPNAAFPHGTRDQRPLARGDLILVDTGGGLHGYRSDITRTWAVGTPTDEARRAWDTVLAAQSAGLNMVRPGVRCEQIDAAARKVIEDAGYGHDYEEFTHRLGHGIGLQTHEDPYLVKGNALELAPGMTFSDEPGIYVPGKVGVRLEDIVAVTADGAEVFGPRALSLDAPFGEG